MKSKHGAHAKPCQPATYEIKVKGAVDTRWSEWFTGLTLSQEPAVGSAPLMTLRGQVPDQAALRGMVNKLWDLNLTLISIIRLGAETHPEATVSTEYILPLNAAGATLTAAGGKGASLTRLAGAGLPVPDGFHITTAAYAHFVAANCLTPRIWGALEPVDASLPATLDAASAAIRRLFAEAEIPDCIARAIAQAYAALPGDEPIVAVRSSATAEDLPGLSFAGQQETFLNLHGAEIVQDAVKRCWASLWTARAIGYRAQHGIDQRSVSLAVVVQLLVPAEASGILFTANPVTGRRDQALITAAWGLGEAIVGGLVTPDTLTLDKAASRVLKRETADKQVMTVRVEGGTEEQPAPKRLRREPVLTDAQASELCRLGLQIETLYGMPMDIEWAWTSPSAAPHQGKGGFAIVQARPITALPEPPLEWPLPHPNAVLARGSFAEFVPQPVSPLFATLAVPIAREATQKLMCAMGVTAKDCYVFAVINGYVYVGMKFSAAMTWQFLIGTIKATRTLSKDAPVRASAARAACLAAAQRWRARDLAHMPPTELLDGVKEIFQTTADYYTAAQSGTIPLSMISELTFAKFYDLLVKRRGDPDAAMFVFGSENQALRAEKALFDLARWAKEKPELVEWLASNPAVAVWATLQAGPKPAAVLEEFATRLGLYLREFGYAIYDLDFAKPTPAEAPGPLVETLKVYLSGKSNPYERQRAALNRREQAAGSITKRLDPLRRRYFLKLLKWAQETAPLREDSIAELGLGYPQLRLLLAELGRRLAGQGAIVDAADVYWLEAAEAGDLAAALENGRPLAGHAGQVADRKARWQAMRRITPPNTLPQKSWMSRFFPSQDPSGAVLKGFGASAGRITARACVMLGPEDFDKMQTGDVIVAGITTPAWTPLFARAAGIVTDIGGPLSHSSIVAREYGIPAVLATANGTRRIRDGQMITVDGSAGKVMLADGRQNGSKHETQTLEVEGRPR
jgi:phosphoenolpyruvate synthase/pyruvate phosphate dikinase